MTDLKSLLEQLESPEPSNTLKSRILQQAKAQRASERPPEKILPEAANDNHWKRWMGIAAMTVILGIVGFSTFSSVPDSEQDVWAETAQTLGYADLYAWVEGETVESEIDAEAS